MSATLQEIAEAAGVSRSTAGLVLNGKAEALRIAPETAARVREAAAGLGYLRNAAVRQLRDKRTSQVAYIMTTPESGQGTVNQFAFSMMRCLQRRGHQTLLIDVTLESNMVNPLFQERRFDGMAIEGTVPNQDYFEDWGRKHGVPHVYLNHDHMERNHAGIDEPGTATALVEELRARGFRRIAYYFPRDVGSNRLYPPDHVFTREKALRAALAAKGLGLYPDTVEQRRHGENTAAYLMGLPEPPDCVVGFNAFHGVEFKLHLERLGLGVPRDVALVVYALCEYNRAARIAGVDFACDTIGEDLAEMLLRRIETGQDQENRLTPGKLATEMNGITLGSLQNSSEFGVRSSEIKRQKTDTMP